MTMRSLAKTSVLSKFPSEMNWLSEKLEKLTMGCNKGYAKLQSSRISRGRLTMTDKADERATAAWSEQVWTKTDGAREWPAVLRPQRPEQLNLNRCDQSQKLKNKRRVARTDVLENPPVFLTIKDIKSLKKAEENSSPYKAAEPKNSPTWPAVFHTYERDTNMSSDIELLGIELAKEYQLSLEELSKRKDQVAELKSKESSYLKEIDNLTGKMRQVTNEVKQVQAQLKIRSVAVQRLESENATMRDTIAKLDVQVQTNSLEKERILQKWQSAESELVSWKKKLEDNEDGVKENVAAKEQCMMILIQLRNTMSKIVAQQENAQKEMEKVEKAAENATTFAELVSNHLSQQEVKHKKIAHLIEESEEKFLKLSVELSLARRERLQYLSGKNSTAEKPDCRYYVEWQNYQENVEKRLAGLTSENQRLLEELNLIQEQLREITCPHCGGKPCKIDDEKNID